MNAYSFKNSFTQCMSLNLVLKMLIIYVLITLAGTFKGIYGFLILSYIGIV